jgi:hypothetical protein
MADVVANHRSGNHHLAGYIERAVIKGRGRNQIGSDTTTLPMSAYEFLQRGKADIE